jgi:hypothetical protein
MIDVYSTRGSGTRRDEKLGSSDAAAQLGSRRVRLYDPGWIGI